MSSFHFIGCRWSRKYLLKNVPLKYWHPPPSDSFVFQQQHLASCNWKEYGSTAVQWCQTSGSFVIYFHNLDRQAYKDSKNFCASVVGGNVLWNICIKLQTVVFFLRILSPIDLPVLSVKKTTLPHRKQSHLMPKSFGLCQLFVCSKRCVCQIPVCSKLLQMLGLLRTEILF